MTTQAFDATSKSLLFRGTASDEVSDNLDPGVGTPRR